VKEDAMTDTFLTEALDRGIGPGPEGPELDTILRGGRRLVRRRRAGAATATLAFIAAVGAGSIAMSELGSPGSTPAAPATDAPADPGGIDEPLSGEIYRFQVRPDGNAIGIGPDAEITFPLGTEVVRHIDDALARAPEELSAAYVVREQGHTRWYLARVWPAGAATGKANLVTGVPGVDAATFEDWIAAQGAS
jgi:hypothetical protein